MVVVLSMEMLQEGRDQGGAWCLIQRKMEAKQAAMVVGIMEERGSRTRGGRTAWESTRAREGEPGLRAGAGGNEKEYLTGVVRERGSGAIRKRRGVQA